MNDRADTTVLRESQLARLRTLVSKMGARREIRRETSGTRGRSVYNLPEFFADLGVDLNAEGESYFSDCPRDEHGWCLPSGESEQKAPTDQRTTEPVDFTPTAMGGIGYMRSEREARALSEAIVESTGVKVPHNALMDVAAALKTKPDDSVAIKAMRVVSAKYSDRSAISVEMEVGGSDVSFLVRDDKPYLYVGIVTLSSQQAGQGRAVMDSIENLARASGIPELRFQATSGSGGEFVGGYAWARMGYDFADRRQAEDLYAYYNETVQSKIGVKDSELPEKFQDALRTKDFSGLRPRDFIDLPQGRNFMLGKHGDIAYDVSKRTGEPWLKTDVGVTSARPGKEPEQVRREMEGFRNELSSISTIQQVTVDLGTGGWDGGEEPTWVTHYEGNGDARRTVVAAAAKYDQDAVLFQRASSQESPTAQPRVNVRFGDVLDKDEQEAIQRHLVTAGVGGWTWKKSGQTTILSAVSVPTFGGEKAKHLASMENVLEILRQTGYNPQSGTDWVEVEAVTRDQYDSELGTRKAA